MWPVRAVTVLAGAAAAVLAGDVVAGATRAFLIRNWIGFGLFLIVAAIGTLAALRLDYMDNDVEPESAPTGADVTSGLPQQRVSVEEGTS